LYKKTLNFNYEDMNDMIQVIQSRDLENQQLDHLKEQVIQTLEPLMHHMISKYAYLMDYDDAYSESSMAVLNAIEDFDFQYSQPFHTYAMYQVKYRLLDLIRDNQKDALNHQTVKLDHYENDEFNKISSIDVNNQLLHSPEINFIKNLEIEYVSKALNILNKKEREIINRIYINKHLETVTQIAQQQHVSKAMISKTHKQAILKMKAYIQHTNLQNIKKWLTIL